MKINIHTLTPVHIGSGREIQSGFEYIYFQQEEKVAVLDPEKILRHIGEENLHLWISCIEKGESITDKLPQLRDKTSAEVADRSIAARQECTKPVREQIRSGSGQTLLPGSSLKGALRTVVFGQMLVDDPKPAGAKRNLGKVDFRGGFRWSDAPLQKILFGKDPNHDIFRLLQVGDAHFGETEIFKTQIVNLKGKQWVVDNGDKGKGISAEVWVEALPPGSDATAEIRFNDILKSRADKFKTFNQNASKLKLPALFKLVNKFTERLTTDEINYWTEKADPPHGFEDYVSEMERMLEQTKNCADNECVLRLGWGSGFRSMTGDWHGAMYDDDYDALVNSLRSRKYEGLMFPKTVRFSGSGTPLGFLKLTI